MTLAFVWMGLIVLIVALGFALTRRQRDTAWKKFAGELGAEFIDGGFFRSSAVRAHMKQWIVTLDTYSVSSGDSSTTYTRIRAPLQRNDGFQFVMFREGLIGRLDKALGAQDIELGVPDFDRDFVLQSNDEPRLRALLADAKIRQLIQGQRSIRFWLKGEALLFEVQGLIKDVDRLKSLYELFGETLDRLQT